jgi:hypothetical protein
LKSITMKYVYCIVLVTNKNLILDLYKLVQIIIVIGINKNEIYLV